MTAMTTHPILDIRTMPPTSRRPSLLSAFDALAPGEALLVVSDDEPRPLLEVLQKQRKGLFEWSPVAEDCRSWHVQITRRSAAPGTARRLTEALVWDHERLDALEGRAFAALAAGDSETARRLYTAFHDGLNRHIRFEEELLFPVFEVKAGLPHGGPTSVMRAEHREIRMLLEDLLRTVEDGPSGIAETRQALRALLEDHDRKEESILYPGTDRLLSEAESDALVARIQAFPC